MYETNLNVDGFCTEDVNGLTGSRVPVHLCTRRLVLELLKVAGCGLHYE